MMNEITAIFNVEYSRIDFCLMIPDCFDGLQSEDANFETSASNSLQPLRLIYEHNVVTDKTAVVFVNPAASMFSTVSEEDQKSKQIEKGEAAEKLLKEFLGFIEVLKFTSLTKAQIIEQMTMLKYRSTSFEWSKQKKNKLDHTLLIATVSIGLGYPAETMEMLKE